MRPRKCHIKRILGRKVSDNSVVSDTWIDVLRIDEYSKQQNAGGQERNVVLRWDDEPGTPGDDTTHAGRQTTTVRVVPASDPTIYFDVKAIRRMQTSVSDQREFKLYDNATANTLRQVTARRVYHVDATLPVSGEWDSYVTALTAAQATRDTTQYVDIELVDSFSTNEQQGLQFQRQTALLKLNADAKPIFAAAGGTPVRLDPYQFIVNLQVAEQLVYFIEVHASIAEANGGYKTGGTDYPPIQANAWTINWISDYNLHYSAYGSGGAFIRGGTSRYLTSYEFDDVNIPAILKTFSFPAATYSAGWAEGTRGGSASAFSEWTPSAANTSGPDIPGRPPVAWNSNGIPFNALMHRIIAGPSRYWDLAIPPTGWDYYVGEGPAELNDTLRGTGVDAVWTFALPEGSTITHDGVTYAPHAYAMIEYPTSTSSAGSLASPRFQAKVAVYCKPI